MTEKYLESRVRKLLADNDQYIFQRMLLYGFTRRQIAAEILKQKNS